METPPKGEQSQTSICKEQLNSTLVQYSVELLPRLERSGWYKRVDIAKFPLVCHLIIVWGLIDFCAHSTKRFRSNLATNADVNDPTEGISTLKE